MAIVTELLQGDFVRTYSDKGFLIHGGSPEADYAEAIDPVYAGRTYVETNIPIEGDEVSDGEALYIITHGEYGKAGDSNEDE